MLIDKFITHIKSINPEFIPNLILDIGSRDLDQSIEFNSVFSDVKIIAFEPNPSQFDICLNKSKEYENIRVEQLAISNTDGTLDFYVTHGNIGASSLLKPINVPFASTQDFTKISVPSVKLGNWLDENNIKIVDIIWLDTQGVELDVLKSMGEKIKHVKFIHCEASELPYYEGHLLKNELVKFLDENGFELKFINESYHPFNEGDIIATNKNI
jgi:FkbM family methyltransferase